MRTGELRWRIGFYKVVAADDGYGNTTSGYGANPEFSVAANVKPKLGGEGIQAGRLAGKNYVNITVRRSSDTALVTNDWRAKDERSGEIYNIRSIIDPDGKREWIEMLCEQGVAA